MRLIVQPTLDVVIETNKFVSDTGGNPHQCLNTDKIESAIASAFYPDTYPFAMEVLPNLRELCAFIS